MRLQSLFFLIVVAIICGHQCSATSTSTKSSRTDGWDWNKNYLDSNEGEYMDNNKNKNRDRDDVYSDEKKPSYEDDDKDSYEKKPTYKDNSNDDDDDEEDYKPSKYGSSKERKSPDELGHMNLYFREPSKDGKRKKSKRFRFPVARYERERFPRTFGPLISFLPWLPIFADRLTKQTIIYSPTGGVYILPPVINFYGKLISVAELIASGYASLVSSGAPPPPAVNIAPLVQPGPVVGPGVPTINPATGGFKGGVRTEFRSFARPGYPDRVEERSAYKQQDRYVEPSSGY